MFLQNPPAVQASSLPASGLPYQGLLEALDPSTPYVNGRTDKEREARAKAIATQILIRREIEDLEKQQKVSIQALKSDRPRMERDLKIPQVASLRALLDDFAFKSAMADYDKDVGALFSKESSAIEDERHWMSQMNKFFLTSAQETLNDTGRISETTTVHLPGTGPSAATLARYQEAYSPIWNRFARAVEDYAARTDEAADAAKKVAPGPTTDAAARIIRIRILRRIYFASQFHRGLFDAR